MYVTSFDVAGKYMFTKIHCLDRSNTVTNIRGSVRKQVHWALVYFRNKSSLDHASQCVT
jgi:hypothetical protein